jgi:choline dehydrogenase-like flavoprotein
VVAARLSQDPDARVLLLEAGQAQPLEAVSVPTAWPILRGSSADWANTTTTQSELQKVAAWPKTGWLLQYQRPPFGIHRVVSIIAFTSLRRLGLEVSKPPR